ncbi:helix-turn-helix domain-containing protein [Citrobacter freundii]|nr:helix-turn-helix domain-containing protein [Citrobacter freundii]MDE8800903.1 helix-turn-helix domain-containing protein [Citrobacter freundii]MDE8806030.1 helix-turn-helix domain-containing protein [Citrobacter freundii]
MADDDRRLEAWAACTGTSPRTVTRRFSVETGFSFTEWRQRVRLLRALELLVKGQPMKAIALDLGYDNGALLSPYFAVYLA